MTQYLNPSTRNGGLDRIIVGERAAVIEVTEAPFDDNQYVRINGEWVPVDTPEIVPDTLGPKPPTALIANGSIVTGGAAVDYALSWTAPTQNTDGTPLTDLAYYVVRWRYTGTGPYASFVSNDSAALLPNLVIGKNIEWGVLARDTSGNDSTWASATITGLTDTVGPQKPSTPVLSTKLGTITATWDGLDYVGNPPPADFDHLNFYVSATTGGPWTYVDRVEGLGSAIITTSPIGATRFVTTVAVDTSSNSSLRSSEASIVVKGVTGPDIEANSITANHITSGAITTVKLDAEAVTSDKIKAAAITADKVAAGAITADKIQLGVLRQNLVPDSSFEDGVPITLFDPTGPSAQGNKTAWRKIAIGGQAAFNPVISTDGTMGRSGRSALKLTTDAAFSCGAISGVFKVTPGVTYKLSVYACSLTAVAKLQVQVAVSATEVFDNTTLSTLDPDDPGYTDPPVTTLQPPVAPPTPSIIWDDETMKYGYEFTPAAGMNFAAVKIRNLAPAATCTLVIDDVSVVEKHVGGASELTGAGLRLFDPDGDEVGAFVSNRPTFFSVTNLGATLSQVRQDGTAAFKQISLAEDLNIRGVNVLGDNIDDGLIPGRESPFQDSVIESLPMGLVQWGSLISSSGQTNTTAGVGLFEIVAPIYANRMYKFCTNSIRVTSTVANDAAELRILATYGAVGNPDDDPVSPLVASTAVLGRMPITTINSTNGEGMMLMKLWSPGNQGLLGHEFLRNCRFLLVLSRVGGTGNVSVNNTSLDPMEFWLEDIGPFKANGGQVNSGGGGIVVVPPPSTPPPKTYIKTFTSTTACCYMANGSKDSSQDEADMKQGYSSYDGDSSSIWIFPAMAATLAGSTISKVRIYLYANHWYNSSGGTGVIKYHGQASVPTSRPSLTSITTSPGWPKPGGRWVDITTTAVKTALLNGNFKGIAVGQAGSTSMTYYGRFNKTGAKIEVTYVK